MVMLKQGNMRDITILIGIALVCYIPALFNGFVNYDDPTLLFENALIQTFSFENTGRIFAEILSGHYSRFNPLVFIAYALIYRFAGFDAFWFHAASILFHTGGTVMVYLLAREMTRNARLSLICALLFAVPPIHVEPVAWGMEYRGIFCDAPITGKIPDRRSRAVSAESSAEDVRPLWAPD